MKDSSVDSIQDVLSSSFELPNGLRLNNRIVKSAMSETLSIRDGRVPSGMAALYSRWAQGGVGLLVTGNVMIDRRALGEPGNVVLEDERDLDELKRWAAAAHEHGSRILMQINHPGRQAPSFINREAVAPSVIPLAKHLRSNFPDPRALTEAEIEDLVQRFARTAAIAEKAGFDGVQIHGAHGYLVSQFLSPLVNQRDDKWGGSTENRRRFPLEIYRAIRAQTSPSFTIGIKINSADFQKGGISEEDSAQTIVALAQEGMDLIEISGGTYEAPEMVSPRKSTLEREAYFLNFAQKVREQIDTPLFVTGGFRSGEGMSSAIQSGDIDLVGLARTLVIDPDFPKRLYEEGNIRVDLPSLKTGLRLVDRSGAAELIWYERQIHRMAKGMRPKPKESTLWALIAHAFTHGPRAFRMRRAK